MDDETAKWELDNGTPVYVLGELRRRVGTRWDSLMTALVGAIDRSGSAIIQADTAKTVQEEVRHLVRALAAAGEIYILAAEHAKGTIDEVRSYVRLPVVPLATDLLQAIDRSCGAVMQSSDGSTAQDEIRHLVRALAYAAQLYTLTAAMGHAACDAHQAAKLAAPRRTGP
jgi:hypothetical protein